MARPLRLEVAGGCFHVMSRGNGGQRVFLEDLDRRAFLRQLKRTCRRMSWECLTYCLMGNHYHLLLRTVHPNLGLGMRDVNGVYAQEFNRRHHRQGHLWQARYRAQLVQDTNYIWAVARYIALNPVRAGIVADPREWRWSAHRALAEGGADDIIVRPQLLQHYGQDIEGARRHYVAMVEASGQPVAELDMSKPIIGDDAFVRLHAPPSRPPADVLKHAWEQARPSLDDLRAALDDDRFFTVARDTHCYALREIADAAGVSVETVRRRCRTADDRCEDLTPRG